MPCCLVQQPSDNTQAILPGNRDRIGNYTAARNFSLKRRHDENTALIGTLHLLRERTVSVSGSRLIELNVSKSLQLNRLKVVMLCSPPSCTEH